MVFMDTELQGTITKAAKEAGKILARNFSGSYRVAAKGRRDIVTEIDIMSEEKIISILRGKYPDYSILSEEAGRMGGDTEYTWIIDPLDGTTNYTVKNPFFNVSIALAKRGKILCGCVYAPITKELFYSEKGSGSFLNWKEIRVSAEGSLGKSLLTFCHGKTGRELSRVADIFRILKPASRDFSQMKSSELELAFVAAGRVDGFVSNGGKPWDAAAGSLLVSEAGGIVTDFSGKEWKFDSSRGSGDLIAANRKIHKEILKRIGEL